MCSRVIPIHLAMNHSCSCNNTSKYRGTVGTRSDVGCNFVVSRFRYLAITLRQSQNVTGINVNGSMTKLCQLADDMTLFLTDSVRNTVNIFEEFYRYAGLKLNKTKTVVFLINPKHVHLKDENLGIKYTDKPLKSLGIWFSSDPAESALLNTTAKINIIKNIIGTL